MKENKKKTALMIIALFFGICVGPSIIGMEESSPILGTILYVGGSGQGNYTNIQDAIDDASGGDTPYLSMMIHHHIMSILM